jgi:hypothetical protein
MRETAEKQYQRASQQQRAEFFEIQQQHEER